MGFKVGDRVRLEKDGLSTRGAQGMLAYVRKISWGNIYPVLIEIDEGGTYETSVADSSEYRFTWATEDSLALVSDTPSPVRTVTRKEIVSGVYGRVRVLTLKGVSDKRVGVRITSDDAALGSLNESELRAAALVLTQLADALEEK